MNTGSDAVNIKEPSACGDDRFNQIQRQVRELKAMLEELNDMSSHKLDELLGAIPCNPIGSEPKSPSTGWLDKIIAEQDAAIFICRELMDRFARI